MTDSVDNVAAGRAAWARPRDRDRATWSDWLDVARALAVGRTEALKAADTNRCVGTLSASWMFSINACPFIKYVVAVGGALRQIKGLQRICPL